MKIDKELFKQYSKDCSALYKQYAGDKKLINKALKEKYGKNEITLRRAKNALKKQTAKTKKHILYLVNSKEYDVYFGTYTKSDKKRRNEDIEDNTLKRYSIEAMQAAKDYIINYDEGKENERHHFHTIEAYKKGYNPIKDEFHKEFRKKAGSCKLLKIRINDKSINKLSRYINKLVNHTKKEQQLYISVKKGTHYQKEKKEYEREMKQFKQIGNCSRLTQKFYQKTHWIQEEETPKKQKS